MRRLEAAVGDAIEKFGLAFRCEAAHQLFLLDLLSIRMRCDGAYCSVRFERRCCQWVDAKSVWITILGNFDVRKSIINFLSDLFNLFLELVMSYGN